MKIAGIITEYNPFHNGHKYQIEEARKQTGADYIIVIMSGSFTQQGNIGMIDKFTRAQIAVDCGADLVIELPTIYATASAEVFSRGAVRVLNDLNSIDYLVFGSECANIEILTKIADVSIQNKKEIDKELIAYLSKGISYAEARSLAFRKFLNDEEYRELSKPNNILGIEYLKSLKQLNSNIKPHVIKRIGAEHNDKNLNNSTLFSSATSIRDSLFVGFENFKEASKFMPEETNGQLLKAKHLTFNEDMYPLLRIKILELGLKEISKIYDVSEGLEYRIFESIIKSSSYTDLIFRIKSKRYPLSRIKRILVHILLGITKEDFDFLNNVSYIRVLKVKYKNVLLSILSKNSSVAIITKLDEKELNSLDDKIIASLGFDFLATNIRQIISNANLNIDKTNKL
ncbi:MAG: nucleotidyltransferase [Clostridia bacterium]|nr:nucleotidyltransferase [Clostridia bacterium]